MTDNQTTEPDTTDEPLTAADWTEAVAGISATFGLLAVAVGVWKSSDYFLTWAAVAGAVLVVAAVVRVGLRIFRKPEAAR